MSASSVGVGHARHHAADAARRREQRGGLALDRRGVVLLGAVDVEEVLQLEHLAAAQLADRRREQRGDVGAERRRQRRRPGEQEVAGEDGHDVAPARVHARHAAAGLGLVDHVVVVERPEVHELARPPPPVTASSVAAAARPPVRGVGGAQGEGRPEALAAGADEVGGDLGEERIGRADRFAQRGVDPLEVGGRAPAGRRAAPRAPVGRSGAPGPVMRPR